MKKAGLLGRSLAHSLSPEIHRHLGDYSYELFEREPEEVGELFTRTDLMGFNVTIPYKTDVMPFCESISPQAERIGCVNTVVFEDGQIVGHNTDYDGFSMTLDHMGIDLAGKQVLILGVGATSRTVMIVCADRNAGKIVRVGRSDFPLDASIRSETQVLINCTPVGMYPNNGKSLVRLSEFENLEAVVDVVYNPYRTTLLLDAKRLGIPAANGLLMLVGQALRAAELFTKNEISVSVLHQIAEAIRIEAGNLVLIGMPGCGKTSLGKDLANLLEKQFVDLDEAIEKEIGMPIPKLFETEGEVAFRLVETEMARKYGKESGLVIATGGGIVKREENYDALAQNSVICYVERDLTALPTHGRPLSAGGLETLKRLFSEREALYQSFADFSVKNEGFNEAIERIREGYYENCRH